MFNGTYMSDTNERERSNLSNEALLTIRNLDLDRSAGNIKSGELSKIKADNEEGDYSGEINDKDEAHGEGRLTKQHGSVYEGTFMNNLGEGFMHVISAQGKIHIIGEMSKGKWVNRKTFYAK